MAALPVVADMCGRNGRFFIFAHSFGVRWRGGYPDSVACEGGGRADNAGQGWTGDGGALEVGARGGIIVCDGWFLPGCHRCDGLALLFRALEDAAAEQREGDTGAA